MIEVPCEENKCRARINKDLIKLAAEEIKISRPILIDWTNYVLLAANYFPTKRRTGEYLSIDPAEPSDTDYYHYIRIADNLPAWKASQTLWHELTHASQCERFPGIKEFSSAYEEEDKRSGYQHNIFEREAQYWAQLHPFSLTGDRFEREITQDCETPYERKIKQRWLSE